MTMSLQSASAQAILQSIQHAATSYAENKPGSREQLLSLSQALTANLELPSEAIQRMGWAEPGRAALCRMAVDLRLFDHLKSAGETGTTIETLAAETEAEGALLSQAMKHLASMGIVKETAAETYAASPLSNAFTEPRFRDGIIYTYDVAGQSFRDLPAYLRSIKYTHPTELTDGPFQYAHKTQLPFFAWLGQNPTYAACFNNYMAAYRAGKPSWEDPGFYSVNQRLINGFDPSICDVMIVDVGGGLGHDLKNLKAKYPNLPGKMILQDQADVISSISEGDGLSKSFEANVHDFFTPQPVHGARAYYLHSVLHDWGDDDCVKILQQLKPAMKKDYSKLLLNELVVPDEGANWSITSMDQLVFVLGAMKERTETQWKGVLQRAGYSVVQIFKYEMGTESLIEAAPL